MLTATSAVIVPSSAVAEDTGSIGNSSENIQAESYCLFYDDKDDIAEIDKVIAEKRDAYIHSLYEIYTDQNEIDNLEAEYCSSLRREMLEAVHSEKSAKILEELGADPAKAFCSIYAPMIICELTDSQLEKAEKMEMIEDISLYSPVVAEPAEKTYSSKEEFIQLFSADENGDRLLDEHFKADAQLNCSVKAGDGKESHIDYLIIYGLSDVSEIRTAVNQMNNSPYVNWVNPIEDYCGCRYSITSGTDKIGSSNMIEAIFFIEDEYPGWVTTESLGSYSDQVGFDIAPYIISLGDTNGDYVINAADASDVLRTYAMLQTKNGVISEEEMKKADVNKDGAIDSADASLILSYYAYASTSGNKSFKDFMS